MPPDEKLFFVFTIQYSNIFFISPADATFQSVPVITHTAIHIFQLQIYPITFTLRHNQLRLLMAICAGTDFQPLAEVISFIARPLR